MSKGITKKYLVLEINEEDDAAWELAGGRDGVLRIACCVLCVAGGLRCKEGAAVFAGPGVSGLGVAARAAAPRRERG